MRKKSEEPMKPISIKISDKDRLNLDMEIKKSGLGQSEYIRRNIFNDVVQVIDKRKEIYQGLCLIESAVRDLEQTSTKVDCSKIREELMKTCQLLNL